MIQTINVIETLESRIIGIRSYLPENRHEALSDFRAIVTEIESSKQGDYFEQHYSDLTDQEFFKEFIAGYEDDDGYSCVVIDSLPPPEKKKSEFSVGDRVIVLDEVEKDMGEDVQVFSGHILHFATDERDRPIATIQSEKGYLMDSRVDYLVKVGSPSH
jgi:hypothetical protein